MRLPDRFGNYVQFQASERSAPADATQIAPVPPDETVEVSIYLKPRAPMTGTPGAGTPAAGTPEPGAAEPRAAWRRHCEQAYGGDIRLIAEFAAANANHSIEAALACLAAPVGAAAASIPSA